MTTKRHKHYFSQQNRKAPYIAFSRPFSVQPSQTNSAVTLYLCLINMINSINLSDHLISTQACVFSESERSRFTFRPILQLNVHPEEVFLLQR